MSRLDVVVSVVIPTLDRWPLLRKAIATATAQEEVAVEIIVVDDGSTDETAAGLDALQEPRLRVLRTAGREGAARARNLGVATARGDWVAFLDDDDLWAPDKLSRQLFAAGAADADLAYASALHVDAAGWVLDVVLAPEPVGLERRLRARNAIPAAASNLLVRTALLRAVGGFHEGLWHLTDWELCLRLVRAGRPARVGAPLVAYLQNPVNLRSRGTVGMMRELAALDAMQPGGAVRSLERRLMLRWIAGAHRDAGRRFRAAGVDARIAASHRSPADLARGVLTLASPAAERRLRARWQARPAPAPPPPWLRAVHEAGAS